MREPGRLTVLAAALGGLMLGGCESGSSLQEEIGGGMPPPDPEPPPEHIAVDFVTLVESLFRESSDTSDPIEVDGLAIDFADEDDPHAFADLLSTS